MKLDKAYTSKELFTMNIINTHSSTPTAPSG